MARYINLDEAIKHLQFDCKAKYPLSYCNGISAAIREIGKLPTDDVVPKSEVDEIVRQWKEEANCWQNNYITELRDNEQTKADVAREIFEEIYEDCFDQFGYINYEALAELKKKYKEGE